MELVGNRRAGHVVPCEQLERLSLPAPVLHDLRWQLDEVPRDVRPAEASHSDPAQQEMHQVAELVEERLHLGGV